MERKSKSEIKKLIAELHSKKQGEEKDKSHAADSGGSGKQSKSAAHNKTYRPKI